jgi:hypothetical protein
LKREDIERIKDMMRNEIKEECEDFLCLIESYWEKYMSYRVTGN